MPRRHTKSFSIAFIALTTFAWFSLLTISHLQVRDTWVDALEYRLLDFRYRILGPASATPDVVFVAIDDKTLESKEAALSGRLLLATLVQKIADNGAQSLVLDVLLADAGMLDVRETLASSLGQIPTVIAAAARIGDDGDVGVVMPHADFVAQAEVGLVNIQTDATGTPRFVPMFLTVEGNALPSMPLVAAVKLIGADAIIEESAVSVGAFRTALDKGAYMPLRLLGPTGTISTLSAASILEDAPNDALSGKLVVLGYSATGTGDLFATPFDDAVPGAEIIATAISQLVGGPYLKHDENTRGWDVLHTFVLSSFCLMVMLRAPLLHALPLVAFGLFVSFTGVIYAFTQGLWLSAALPLVGCLPLIVLLGVLSLAKERRIARSSEQSLTSLRRFQSPALARQIERNPDFLSQPQQKELVVYFVDLTGFTALSQRLGAEGTRELLRQFHEFTGEIVENNNGNVINYMGDGVLAVFGLEQGPENQSSADFALRSAEAVEGELASLSLSSSNTIVKCRTGLHYGSVILSRLGAQNHQQVTVSGDTVNLASRLMEIAKSENARIVATSDFASRLTQSAFLIGTKSTRIEVRGWRGDVEVLLWPRE